MAGLSDAPEAFDAYIKEIPGEILGRIAETVKTGEAAITDGAVSAFGSVCGKALSLQKTAELGEVLTICFSLLRVDFAKRKGVYRIDVCDDRWLVTEKACAGYWEAAFAFGPYFELIDELKKKRGDFGIGIREVDTEEYFFALSVVPELRVRAFLAGIAGILASMPPYRALSRREGCTITVGEYRGAQEIIYRERDGNGKSA
jgi:hypothetical protein